MKVRASAFDSARRNGFEACRMGMALSDCPYPDYRGGEHGQVVSWSRAFRNAWVSGFKECRRLREEAQDP